MVCGVKEQQRKKNTNYRKENRRKKKKKKKKSVMSGELQNTSQCADQLLCLSLRNAVALAVIH